MNDLKIFQIRVVDVDVGQLESMSTRRKDKGGSNTKRQKYVWIRIVFFTRETSFFILKSMQTILFRYAILKMKLLELYVNIAAPKQCPSYLTSETPI